jgi:hypothetical protein
MVRPDTLKLRAALETARTVSGPIRRLFGAVVRIAAVLVLGGLVMLLGGETWDEVVLRTEASPNGTLQAALVEVSTPRPSVVTEVHLLSSRPVSGRDTTIFSASYRDDAALIDTGVEVRLHWDSDSRLSIGYDHRATVLWKQCRVDVVEINYQAQ